MRLVSKQMATGIAAIPADSIKLGGPTKAEVMEIRFQGNEVQGVPPSLKLSGCLEPVNISVLYQLISTIRPTHTTQSNCDNAQGFRLKPLSLGFHCPQPVGP